MSNIEKVVAGGYCIGCGACAYKDTTVKVISNEYGLFQAEVSQKTNILNKTEICPFVTSKDETILGKKYFSDIDNIEFDKKIGFYLQCFAGYVREDSYREHSSSGGMASWILCKMLSAGEIDAVIHVGGGEKDDIFTYSISYTEEEIKGKTKSRYYPTHFDEVLSRLDLDKKYAFIGVPCYIKALRLLTENDEKLKRSIKYFIGIFCGHLKSKAYAEMLAWQQGIKPRDLKNVDFRVKKNNKTADNYKTAVTDNLNNTYIEENRKLYGVDWGLGFFKPKACDWCDDVSAELADVVLGDAWLPEYTHDPLGTNIVIVRNSILLKFLAEGVDEEILHLEKIPVEKVIESQAGNYRHREEGLSVRIVNANKLNIWHPKKRVDLSYAKISKNRVEIYLLRELIAQKSHIYFKQAKLKENFAFFLIKMLPFELKYAMLYTGIKGSIKKLIKNFYCLMIYHFLMLKRGLCEKK